MIVPPASDRNFTPNSIGLEPLYVVGVADAEKIVVAGVELVLVKVNVTAVRPVTDAVTL